MMKIRKKSFILRGIRCNTEKQIWWVDSRTEKIHSVEVISLEKIKKNHHSGSSTNNNSHYKVKTRSRDDNIIMVVRMPYGERKIYTSGIHNLYPSKENAQWIIDEVRKGDAMWFSNMECEPPMHEQGGCDINTDKRKRIPLSTPTLLWLSTGHLWTMRKKIL